MSSNASIFKPRHLRPLSSVKDDTGVSNESIISNFKTAHELTKNEKYCVSRLPALPAVLENASTDSFINAYADKLSGYALLVDETSIHVWNYNSTDVTPLSIHFPLQNTNGFAMPLAILTKPLSGTSQDPGLVIINSTTGLAKFYESVHHAPALGLLNNEELELQLPINSEKGEYITIAENLEPAGIVIATSWKRCLVLSLRDYMSKPHLSYTEILAPSNKSGFLRSIFGSSDADEDRLGDEIVSIKAGRTSNRGLTQEIIIQESGGIFHLFAYQLFSASGKSVVDKRKTVKQDLGTYLENNMDSFLPGSSLSIRFLDLWPLCSEEYNNTYLALIFIDEMYHKLDGKNLFLITVKVDETGVLLYGSHKLQGFDNSAITSKNKPKLYVPYPGKTAFVLLEHSLILQDINTSSLNSSRPVQYYRPKWEDIIKFSPALDIVGEGYEDHVKNYNPAIILITRNYGVIRVERFIENDAESDEPMDDLHEVRLAEKVKSHIEQGIFYSDSPAIDFNIGQDYPGDIISNAVKEISTEVLTSTSDYLPQSSISVVGYLTLKMRILEELLKYSFNNFPDLQNEIIPEVVSSLEKVTVGLQLWEYICLDQAKYHRFSTILFDIISKLNILHKDKDDIVKVFFTDKLQYINQVLTEFIDCLSTEDYGLDDLVNLVVGTVYHGVYEHEQVYVVSKGITPFRSWIFDTFLIFKIAQLFSKRYNGQADDISLITETLRNNLVKLSELLYYFTTSAITFMQESKSTESQLEEYLRWYETTKFQWIKALISYGCKRQASNLAEKYRDLSSLCFILEAERLEITENFGEDSPEYQTLTSSYAFFLHKFGYDFASSLFDYYMSNNDIQSLFIGAEEYKSYVKKYFKLNFNKTSSISWIQSLVDAEYEDAAEALLYSSAETNDELVLSKEIKLSLAKLASVAAMNTSDSVSQNNKAVLKNQTGSRLAKLQIESDVTEKIKKISGTTINFSIAFFIKNFTNTRIEEQYKVDLLSPFFDQFTHEKELSSHNLISLLTLLNPTGEFSLIFRDAIVVSSCETDETASRNQITRIWIRLLASTDDWNVISQYKNAPDEDIKRIINNSVLAHTIKALGSNSKAYAVLEDILAGRSSRLAKQLEQSGLSGFEKSEFDTLQTYIEQYDLNRWVQAVKIEFQ